MNIGDKVKAFQGEFTGFYGVITDINEGVAMVAKENSAGMVDVIAIDLADLQAH